MNRKELGEMSQEDREIKFIFDAKISDAETCL